MKKLFIIFIASFIHTVNLSAEILEFNNCHFALDDRFEQWSKENYEILNTKYIKLYDKNSKEYGKFDLYLNKPQFYDHISEWQIVSGDKNIGDTKDFKKIFEYENHLVTIDNKFITWIQTYTDDYIAYKKDEQKKVIEFYEKESALKPNDENLKLYLKVAKKDFNKIVKREIIKYHTDDYFTGLAYGSKVQTELQKAVGFPLSGIEINIENASFRLGLLSSLKKGDYDKYSPVWVCASKLNKDAGGSSGTAFFINLKGYLLTNNHVVEGCELQQVKYNDKDYEAKIVATDKTLDLALMKIDVRPKNYLKFSESSLEKLQKVYVAGYPFGKGLSDDLKISSGIVSSVKGFDDNSNEFQLDAAINPGNSGGPIVADTGELIGIAVAGLAKDKSEGINFGIKSLSAVAFLKTNNIDPETSIMTFGMNNKKLLQLLEESTVYTYCN